MFSCRERKRMPPYSSSSSNFTSSNGAVNYIEHHVSNMDTLAGVAIKYGVEVADIKRMNGLVTDLQMFALKSLRIPLPGRHPPSSNLSNGTATPKKRTVERASPRRIHSEVLESLQSLGLKAEQRRVTPAMNSLRGYYGLETPKGKSLEEGNEMTVYKTGRYSNFKDEIVPKSLRENGELATIVSVADSISGEVEKSEEKSVRRRQKVDTEVGSRSPGENNSESAKGWSLRPKSVGRSFADISWLNPIPLGLGESLMANGFVGMVRKSSSTSSLQDQESNGSTSIWPTSRWSLKPDLQAFSATSIARPIFDGLPKPVNGRRNKAALD